MAETWRLLLTGYGDGPTNMAIDEAIMNICGGDGALPTVRFYQWEPPCISIGYFQSAKDLDLDDCRRLGIDLVRRPTGGRAILHDCELTYSIVAPDSHRLMRGGVVESYCVISQGFLEGLRHLGVQASFAPPLARQTEAAAAFKSPVCFEAPSDHELVVDGKKIIGSAQVRGKGAVLQHGSLLLETDPAAMATLYRVPSENERQRLLNNLTKRITSVGQCRGGPVSFGEVAEALKTGFEKAFGITLVPGSLTAQEWQLAEELRANKYATDEWNFKR